MKQAIRYTCSILLFSFVGVMPLLAQIDSLKQVIATTDDDSLRVQALMRLGFKYESFNLDSAYILHDQAIEVAQRNNLKTQEAKAWVNKSLAYFYGSKSKESLQIIKRSFPLYKENKEWGHLCDAYYNLGFYFSNFDQLDSSIYYYKKAIPLGEKIQDKTRLARSYTNIGLMYQYQGKYDLSITHTLKAIALKKELKNPTIGLSIMNLGVLYHKMGNNLEAINTYQEGFQYIPKDDTYNIALGTKNIGDSYADLKNYEAAMDYLNKAEKGFLALNDSNQLSSIQLSLSNMSESLEDLNKSKKHLDSALAYFPSNGSPKLLMNIHYSISTIPLTNDEGLSRKGATIALKHASKSYELAKQIDSHAGIVKSAYVMSRAHAGLGNTNEAYKMAHEYITLKDSLMNSEKQRTLAELQTQYETEKKELEIEFLNKENQLQAENLDKSTLLQEKQQTIIYSLIVGLIVIAIFLIVIYRLYQDKNKTNKELASKNELISQQKEEKEVLLKEIHHRVKNNLQIISSLLDLQSRSTENPITKAAVSDGQNRVKSMALIHQLLYQNQDAAYIQFNDYLDKLITQIKSSHPNSNSIEQSLSLPDNLKFDIDTAIPLGLIITELLTNAYKYAFDKIEAGNISIELDSSDEQYKLTVKDNGHGLPEGFDLKKSKSLGLRLVRTLSKQLKGKVDYQNDNGAKFILYFEAGIIH